MELRARHVVAITGFICAVAVLAPVGVMAATGSINIADPFDGTRRARVSTDGALRVESRAGSNGYTFNKTSGDLGFAGSSAALIDTPYPNRIAITEMSVASDTYINPNNAQYSARVEIYQLTRTSGTNACALSASGWTQKLLRYVSVASGSTTHFSFAGSPLVLIPASGQRACLAVFVRVMPTYGHVFVGASGYTFTP